MAPRSQSLVTLERGVDPALVDALRDISEIDVVVDAPQSVVMTATGATAVAPAVVTVDDLERPPRTSGRTALLLIEGVLDAAAAARLEDDGIGFVDRSGRWWLPGTPRSPTTSTPTTTSQPRRMRGPRIRMAQLLVDHPGHEWTERRLADRARSTQQTAHQLLSWLERHGYVERIGTGRSSHRRVADPRPLAAWLIQVAAPPRGGLLRCYVPDPDDLEELHVPLVLTGASAAAAVGFRVLTGTSAPIYRARTTRAVIDEIPSELGGFRTDRGHNLSLLADADDLAYLDATRLEDGRLVAPPSRIMLDLALEPRGRNAMAAFMDLWLARGGT
jgi:hypothetical protein